MGLLDRIKNIPNNPLAMAGLGLLSMPTKSRYPINPLEYAMQGMQAGVQNQQAQQELAFRKQQEEQQKREYQLRIAEYQRKAMMENEAAVQQRRQQDMQSSYIAKLPPEQQALAQAYPGLFEYQMKESMKAPPGPQSSVGKLAADMMAADPSLNQKAAMAAAEQKMADMKRAGATSVNVNTGGPFKVPTNYMMSPDEQSVIPIPGGPADPSKKELTETQAKGAMFYNRANEINQQLGSSNYNPSGIMAAKDWATTGGSVTNWAASDKGQEYIAQAKNFIASILRQESGATITETEWESGKQLYIPLPGDSAAVKAQKEKNRSLAIEGLKVASGPGAGRFEKTGSPQIIPGAAPGVNRPNTRLRFDAEGNPQ